MASGDVNIAYGASSALTVTLASLAASSTLVAGRQSTPVDNTTTLYLDYLVGGKITTGTTPTAGSIEVWAFGSEDDTPTYPDGLGAADAAYTATSADIKRGFGKLLASIPNDTTSNRAYWFGPVSIAAAFGGSVPKKWGVVVTHSTGVALNATAGNHAISSTPVYMTTAP